MKVVVALLLLSTCAPYAEGDTVSGMIVRATMLGDLKTLETLLSNGASPDVPDRYGQTPLYLVCSLVTSVRLRRASLARRSQCHGRQSSQRPAARRVGG